MPADNKYVNGSKLQKELFNRTEKYAENVRRLYIYSLNKIIGLVKGTELIDGVPFSFDEYGYSNEVTEMLRSLYSSVYKEIRQNTEMEWIISDNHNDDLIKSIFGSRSIPKHHYARLFTRNQKAMDAFLNRKSGVEGLNLSQRVWQYVGQFKTELEDSLDLALGEGTPANRLASKIQHYLQDPDRFYRRFRVKIGVDENGEPLFGRKWKRRIFDKDIDGYRWVDEDPKKYKSGRGVYRSSYRNAQRLARTEPNIAYRTADHDRWSTLDFVVGFEIRRSNNPYPCPVCEALKGRYPKSFLWTGWHPNCRCFKVPILATQDEIEDMISRMLIEDNPAPIKSNQTINELPSDFKQWIRDNQLRMDAAKSRGTLPYFIKDNPQIIKKVLGTS